MTACFRKWRARQRTKAQTCCCALPGTCLQSGMPGTDGVFNSMGEGMLVNYEGTILEAGNSLADEIVTGEVRPKLCDEARHLWGVENNIYQFGHRGFTAVQG